MKKLKAFFYVFAKSLTSPEYYKDLIKTTFGFSVKYYLVLVAFASLIAATANTLYIVPEVKTELNIFVENAKSYFPEDLEIKFEDSQWEINKPEPYFFPLTTSEDSEVSNLVVFDKDGTIEDMETYNTIVLINEKNMIMVDPETNGLKTYPLDEIPDTVINYEDFDQIITFAYKFINILPYFFFAIVVFGLLVYYLVMRAVYTAVMGLVVLLVSQLTSLKLDYKKSTQIALHTMTLPIVVSTLLEIVDIQVTFPFAFFILNLALSGFVLYKLNKKSSPKAE